MNRKIIGYIGVALIGVGFIAMAASNVLKSDVASILQAITGALFIVIGVIKIVKESNNKN